MRHGRRMAMGLAALVLAALPAGATGAPGADDPASKFDLTAMPLEKAVVAGANTTARLVLLFKGDASHHWGAPLKVVVTGKGIVAPTKTTLGRADAVAPGKDKNATKLEFDLPFVASAKGEGSLTALVSVFVCTEKSCDPVDRMVSWTIRVE